MRATCASEGRPADAAQLGVEKADVEGSVVDDDLGVAHELDQLVDDVGEERLVGEEFLREAVHL